MSRFTDQKYLKEQQYKTPSNLEARIALHRQFGTTEENWFHWVFQHAAPHPGDRLLEIGCGPGDLWRECAALLPESLSLTLCDLSIGMLNKARTVSAGSQNPHYCVVDAQDLPFLENCFDAVLANHMLYHVPDIPRALGQIRRVMKPNGRLVAATNGVNHMLQLDALIHKHMPEYEGVRSVAHLFSLENGVEILSPFFPRAQVFIFENDLKVTEVEPLANYIRSIWVAFDSPVHQRILQEIIAEAQAEIDGRGYFFIKKTQGLILASA